MAPFPVGIFVLICAVNFLATAEGRKRKLSADGSLRTHPRVIGGAEVLDRCREPYNSMVALQMSSPDGPLTFCSAVMVNESILVTTALCASQIASHADREVVAVLGERDLFMKDREEQRITIESVKTHPGYSADNQDNDIALLRLDSPGTLSSCVRPAAKMENDPGACTDLDSSCTIVGWGPYLENSKPTNSRLARAASVIVFGDLVTSMWANRGNVQRPVGALYAEGTNPRVKTCLYDWGSIVSCQRNGKYVLRGLVSSQNCYTDTPLPMFITDVTVYQSWMNACQRNWERC